MKIVYKVVSPTLESAAIVNLAYRLQYTVGKWTGKNIFCFDTAEHAREFIGNCVWTGSKLECLLFEAEAKNARKIRCISNYLDAAHLEEFWKSNNKRTLDFITKPPPGTLVCERIKLTKVIKME